MLQIFKYNLKQLLHNRSELFWVILFPIILGSLFKAAFSNITAGEKFQAIPVAIVNEQGSMSDGFMETVKELDKDDKDRFLKAVYCDKKQALSLLKKEKVDGIIQVDDNISLTVSSDMSSAKLNQSILSAFIEEYQMNYQAIVKIVKTHPEKLSEAMDILQESASYNQEISYGKNVDTYDQYFYNLLAMVSMYCGTAGCLIAIQNQGNMSAIGRPQECITDPQIKRHYRRTCSKYPVSFSLYFNLFCLYYPCFKDSAEYQTSVCTLSNFYRMYDRYDHGIFHRCHWKHVGKRQNRAGHGHHHGRQFLKWINGRKYADRCGYLLPDHQSDQSDCTDQRYVLLTRNL